VLRQPEQLRRDRRLRQRRGAVPVDMSRHLDDVLLGESADRGAVADVDDLDVAGVRRERADQADCALAVEGAAALLEEGRFLGQLRVALHLE